MHEIANVIVLLWNYLTKNIDSLLSMLKINLFDEVKNTIESLNRKVAYLDEKVKTAERTKNNALKKFREDRLELDEMIITLNERNRLLRLENHALEMRIEKNRKNPSDIIFECEKITSNLNKLEKNLEECSMNNLTQQNLVQSQFSQLVRSAARVNFFSKNQSTQTDESYALISRLEAKSQTPLPHWQKLRDPLFMIHNPFPIFHKDYSEKEEPNLQDIIFETKYSIHKILTESNTMKLRPYIFNYYVSNYPLAKACQRIKKIGCLCDNLDDNFEELPNILKIFALMCGFGGYKGYEVNEIEVIKQLYQYIVDILEPGYFTSQKEKKSMILTNLALKSKKALSLKKRLIFTDFFKRELPYDVLFEDLKKKFSKYNFFFVRLVRLCLKKSLMIEMLKTKKVQFDLEKMPNLLKSVDSTIKTQDEFYDLLNNFIKKYQEFEAKYSKDPDNFIQLNQTPLLESNNPLQGYSNDLRALTRSHIFGGASNPPPTDTKRDPINCKGVIYQSDKDTFLKTIFDSFQLEQVNFEIIVKSQTSNFFFFYAFLYALIKPMAVIKPKGMMNINVEGLLVECLNALNLHDIRYWLGKDPEYRYAIQKIDNDRILSMSNAYPFHQKEIYLQIYNSILKHDQERAIKRSKQMDDDMVDEILKEFKEYTRIMCQARNPKILSFFEESAVMRQHLKGSGLKKGVKKSTTIRRKGSKLFNDFH